MKRLVLPACTAFLVFLGTPSSAQVDGTIGVGLHAEGAGVGSGFQVLPSVTVPTSVPTIRLRGEIYAGTSRTADISIEGRVSGPRRTVVGLGAGVQVEGKGSRARPYAYAGPTYSFFDYGSAQSSSWRPGLAGGAGLSFPIGGGRAFAELSWRGHGEFPFDDTTLAAVTFGIDL